MKRQLNKLNQGFTIIEVLIVLAIAGLILAIVFLAVPALQRSSRNTSIKNDAAGVLAGVNDYIANNGGALPGAQAAQTGPDITIGTTGATTQAKVRGGTTVTFSAGGCNAAVPALGAVEVHSACKCSSATAMIAANRAVAVWYPVELSSAATGSPQCLDS